MFAEMREKVKRVLVKGSYRDETYQDVMADFMRPSSDSCTTLSGGKELLHFPYSIKF